MIALPLNLILEQAKNFKLLYWQINDGTNTIQRQDDEITLTESLTMLESIINSIKSYAKPGDKVKIAMQNLKFTDKGAPKGAIHRSFNYYLFTEAATGGGNYAANSNEALIRQLAQYQAQEEFRERENGYIKRLEALEQNEEGDATTSAINGIMEIINHPLAATIIQLFNAKSSAAQAAPLISGLDSVDALALLRRMEKIDQDFILFFSKFADMAEKDNDKYFNIKNMLMLS